MKHVSLPVLVEATPALITQMLSKNCPESAQAIGSLNVTNNSHTNHWWCLNNSDCLNNLFLVGFC